MEDLADLVDGHLSEPALEALAGDREDLLAPDARAHVDACGTCRQRVADARGDVARVSAALRVELAESELDALVLRALDAAIPAALTVSSARAPATAPLHRPSRAALLVAALLGTLGALTLGALSLDGLPSLGGVLRFAHDLRAVSSATDRLVDALVPGGWGTLALALSALLAALLVPLRALLVPRRSPAGLLSRAGSLTLGLLLGVLWAPSAHALDFSGDWPADEHLNVVAEGVPASVALERAAQAAGLGFVGALATDPPTHLRVRDASLRDIVIAVLGSDAPLVAERTATLLVVRRAPAPVVEPTAVAPSSGAPPPVPSPQTMPFLPAPPPPPRVPALPRASDAARRAARERASFGGDVIVRAGEVVESVVTMGGDATIEGEVLREVVTMGGDVHVRRGGIVHGEIVAMGGRVEVDEGARTTARVELGATPGGISVRGRHGDDAPRDADDDVGARAADAASEAAGALAGWLRDTLASASRHALLFLFGLLLLGLAPARLDAVTRAIATLPARAVATGLLSAVAAGVLSVVLIITIVGIPGAVLLALGAALGVYGGLVAVAAVIGRILPIRALEGRPVLQLAAGVLVLFLVARVPVVGGLAPLVAALIGLGAVVVTRAGTRAA